MARSGKTAAALGLAGGLAGCVLLSLLASGADEDWLRVAYALPAPVVSLEEASAALDAGWRGLGAEGLTTGGSRPNGSTSTADGRLVWLTLWGTDGRWWRAEGRGPGLTDAANAAGQALGRQAPGWTPEDSQGPRGNLEDSPALRGSPKDSQEPRGNLEDSQGPRGSPRDSRLQLDVASVDHPVGLRPLHAPSEWMLRTLSGHGPAPWSRPSLAAMAYEVEPGVHGLWMGIDGHQARMLPDDPVALDLLTPRVRGRERALRAMLAALSLDAAGQPGSWQKEEATLRRFRTAAFVRRGRDGATLPVTRGRARRENRPRDDLDRAAGWLANRVEADGRFEYEILPEEDPSAYNVVRHAGAVAGLFELAKSGRIGDSQALRTAGQRGLGWLLRRLLEPEKGLLAVADEEGVMTAGTAGFTMLALLDGPGDTETEAGLGAFLLAMTDDEGRVRDRWTAPSGGEQHPWFPGIALLALSRGAEARRQQAWQVAALRIAAARMRDVGPIPDHWTIQGLGALHRLTGDPALARGALHMADVFLAEQYGHNAVHPAYVGGFRRRDQVPRTIRAASRCEALGAAVSIARRLGADPGPYVRGLRAAAAHVSASLVSADDPGLLPGRPGAVGGFRLGLVDNHLRIDGNKHAARCLLRAREIGVVP